MQWIALYLPQLELPANPCSSERSAHAEQMHGLALWAGRFTPNVSLQDECGLLLEVSGTLKLFGGLRALAQSLCAELETMQLQVQAAGAPTATAAWYLALAGQRRLITQTTRLPAALSALPLAKLRWQKNERLWQQLGLRTIGDLQRLARGGVARRFGQPVLDRLDQALGRLPEAREFFRAPACFHSRLEFAAEVQHVEALDFALQRLMLQLSGFLAARNAAVPALRLSLEHRQHAQNTCTEVALGLIAPSRDIEHISQLWRERLARLHLCAPICAIALHAEHVVAQSGDNHCFFQDEVSIAGEWPRLVEQLRARLGPDSVQSIALRAEHRPELASQYSDIGTRSPALHFGLRPLWLLPGAQALQERDGLPYYEGPLKLLAGPERIEAGWWDGPMQSRDYFVAQRADDALLWIYRQAGQAWYLHGWFA
jgi:protein ImuB